MRFASRIPSVFKCQNAFLVYSREPVAQHGVARSLVNPDTRQRHRPLCPPTHPQSARGLMRQADAQRAPELERCATETCARPFAEPRYTTLARERHLASCPILAEFRVQSSSWLITAKCSWASQSSWRASRRRARHRFPRRRPRRIHPRRRAKTRAVRASANNRWGLSRSRSRIARVSRS